MKEQQAYDVIIVGGSYAGLSAAMSLGRSLRRVLVIDGGNPCNKQTPHTHNFLTNDGSTPLAFSQLGREQVLKYPTVHFINGVVTDVIAQDAYYDCETDDNRLFTARKIIFATGITDTIPNIEGFAECWGISVLHCPYCHGYEVRDTRLGILGNGDQGYELAKTISHWSKNITLFTNGTSTLNPEQVLALNKHNIIIVENCIESIDQKEGNIRGLVFKDIEPEPLDALFTQLPFIQQCLIPEKLGCEMTDKGFINVDKCLETTIPGIFGAGDCLTLFRTVANAVAAGNKVGAIINKKFIEEDFYQYSKG